MLTDTTGVLGWFGDAVPRPRGRPRKPPEGVPPPARVIETVFDQSVPMLLSRPPECVREARVRRAARRRGWALHQNMRDKSAWLLNGEVMCLDEVEQHLFC